MKKEIPEENEIHPEDVKEMFHKLWSKAVGTEGYVKADWKKFRDNLRELTGLSL